jgi:hypothetical protein
MRFKYITCVRRSTRIVWFRILTGVVLLKTLTNLPSPYIVGSDLTFWANVSLSNSAFGGLTFCIKQHFGSVTFDLAFQMTDIRWSRRPQSTAHEDYWIQSPWKLVSVDWHWYWSQNVFIELCSFACSIPRRLPPGSQVVVVSHVSSEFLTASPIFFNFLLCN